jgi:hypothetical protein
MRITAVVVDKLADSCEDCPLMGVVQKGFSSPIESYHCRAKDGRTIHSPKPRPNWCPHIIGVQDLIDGVTYRAIAWEVIDTP